MPLTPEQRTERAKLAARTRWDNEHDRAFYADVLERKIAEVVAKAPPLTPEQIEHLRSLLGSAASREAA